MSINLILLIINKKNITKLKWTTFKDKTVLVTGAFSGIGLSISKELAKREARIINFQRIS